MKASIVAGSYTTATLAPGAKETLKVTLKAKMTKAGKDRFPSCRSAGKPDSPAMPSAPEADPRFNEFIILQAQNAGLFLGQIPNPHSGEKQVNLRAAKSVMDSLEMLASKTCGNLTASEAKLLATALDNLRPLFQAALASAKH